MWGAVSQVGGKAGGKEPMLVVKAKGWQCGPPCFPLYAPSFDGK